MKTFKTKPWFELALLAFLLIITSCQPNGKKNQSDMNKNFSKGTYGFDVDFFVKNKISFIELKDSLSNASVLIIPGYQGRVMTSSANGNEGASFGWINYSLIESGKLSKQFNPFGGEERLWIGPEGGPFSIYFPRDKEQEFQNWVVPKEIDTEPFDIVEQTKMQASFKKDFTLCNASGTNLQVGIERKVKLFSRGEAEQALGLTLDNSLSFVAYQSENTMINKGQNSWDRKTGALSIWMLAMFNPSVNGVVFIPYIKGDEKEFGKIVTDDYFGKVPSERLIDKDGMLFFKTDGKLRSKIGLSPKRALPYSGSYDPDEKVLTILWYSAPDKPSDYVNSKWGKQDHPFVGDAVNSYNDGPVADGSIMGPFYEIESSSPAAFLEAGGKIIHTQRIFHISGDEKQLTSITEKLFNRTLDEIKQVFNTK